MTDRLLTRSEVEDKVRLKASAIYRNMRKGGFPLPLKVGPKSVRWKESEIEAWIASRPRAVGESAAAS